MYKHNNVVNGVIDLFMYAVALGVGVFIGYMAFVAGFNSYTLPITQAPQYDSSVVLDYNAVLDANSKGILEMAEFVLTSDGYSAEWLQGGW